MLTELIRENYRPISKEEELEAVRNGDIDKVVMGMLPLIMKAAVYRCRRIDRMDLVEDAFSIGAVELVRYIRKTFNPDKDARVSTTALLAMSTRIEVGLRRLTETGGIRRTKAKKVGPNKVEFVPTEVSATGGIKFWGERAIFSRAERLPQQELDDFRDSIKEAGLSEKEREVVERRFIGDTLLEIGSDLGVCRERVRQIEKEAIKKMRIFNGVDPKKLPIKGGL